jgi:hypothetical protein
MSMSKQDAEEYFLYTIEGQLRCDLEEVRKLNTQLAKALMDALAELKKVKKKLAALETQMAQQNLKV